MNAFPFCDPVGERHRLVRDWGYVEPDPKYVATLRFLWGGISTQACGELSVVLWTQNRMPDSTVRWIVRISDTTHVRSNVLFFDCQKICQIGIPDRMPETMPERYRKCLRQNAIYTARKNVR